MCMSPDGMSTSELEYEVQRLKEWLDNPNLSHSHSYYESRIRMLESYLKERAEAGTY